MIALRRATMEDIPDIMRFMDEHWKPGNILAKDQDFFEWQFLDGDKLNIFLGRDEDDGKIYGIMGAVVYNSTPNPDVSGCTWQVVKSSNPMLGLDLSEYMYNQLHVRYCCAAGLSQKAVQINALLGAVITEMDHYYRLADRSDYRIARVVNKIIPEIEDTGYSLETVNTVEEMQEIISEESLAALIPGKDYGYIAKRYFGHPIYHYDIWKIVDDKGVSRSVLITRDEFMQDSRVCEIIDHYGRPEDLGKITSALDRLMEEREYEFVDVYSFGIPVEIYEQGGFVRCGADSENIIPNYFHPFVQENITLTMVDPMLAGLRMFRGDGDQDRPC